MFATQTREMRKTGGVLQKNYACAQGDTKEDCGLKFVFTQDDTKKMWKQKYVSLRVTHKEVCIHKTIDIMGMQESVKMQCQCVQ